MSYLVVVKREDDAWIADVPAVQGAHTYSRSLKTLERYVREAIVLADDLPDEAEGAIELEWEFHTGFPELDEKAERVRQERLRLMRESAELMYETTRLVSELTTKGGYSVRDAGKIAGLSHQRVSQLMNERHAV